MKVHRRVAGVIVGRLPFPIAASETLDARCRLYQRSVRIEVLYAADYQLDGIESLLGAALRGYLTGGFRGRKTG